MQKSAASSLSREDAAGFHIQVKYVAIWGKAAFCDRPLLENVGDLSPFFQVLVKEPKDQVQIVRMLKVSDAVLCALHQNQRDLLFGEAF